MRLPTAGCRLSILERFKTLKTNEKRTRYLSQYSSKNTLFMTSLEISSNRCSIVIGWSSTSVHHDHLRVNLSAPLAYVMIEWLCEL